MKPLATLLTAVLMLCTAVQTASAEVFVLSGGGRLTGQLVNPQQSPRQNYVVQVADGAQVVLDAAQVEQVLRPRAEELEYDRIRPTYADTAAAQWELAEWCREHRLAVQREAHLRRVVELDPNQADARHALGYSQIDGKWATRDEIMTQRGYQRYKGRWRLPQEIQLLKEKEKLDDSQQEWFQKVKRWRGWLGTDRNQQACANFRAIDDPMAVAALAKGLRDDSAPAARLLYIDALARIDTPTAAKTLAIVSLDDPVEEVRLSCLDQLAKKERPQVTGYYVGKLRSKDNQVVNLAALGLGRMKDPSAIRPLIDALVTVHKFKITKPGGDGSMSTTFGSGGGGGLAMGGGPKIIRQHIPNQAVLDALIVLTGHNFNFDKRAWKYWYAAQKKPANSLDARRD